MPVLAEDFKEAMARFPSGVTIVTTIDDNGRPWGFTATAFSSLSLSPPLVLACLAGKAECMRAFTKASCFAVNILRPQHKDLAIRFATKCIDKFAGDEFSAGEKGAPILLSALVTIECTLSNKYPGGDHVILVGAVDNVMTRRGEASVYFAGKFHALSADD
jgi:flavin reductase ActVB